MPYAARRAVTRSVGKVRVAQQRRMHDVLLAIADVSLDSATCLRRQLTLGFSLARGRSSLSMKLQGST
jgi:hypothetical protein